MQMFTGGRPFTYNYTLEKTSDNQLYLSVLAPQTQQQLQPGRSDAQRSADEFNRETERRTNRMIDNMEDESRARTCALGLC